jgi:hypothetical protein
MADADPLQYVLRFSYHSVVVGADERRVAGQKR